jgi:hypothetical protein
MVFGTSGWPNEIMSMYGLRPEMIGRFRDHWVERDGDDALILAVYTRNGGGNREEYAGNNAAMQALPTYIEDADDNFDNTYATFRFRMTREQITAWLSDTENVDVDDETTVEQVVDQLFHQAEPTRRDMDVVWQAMIATLPGGIKE